LVGIEHNRYFVPNYVLLVFHFFSFLFNKHTYIMLSKSLRIIGFLSLMCLPIAAKSQAKVVLDKLKGAYALGEQAQFRISTTVIGKVFYEIILDPRDSRSIVKKGDFTAKAGRLDTVVTFTMASGGVVLCRVFQEGSPAASTVAVFDPLSIKPLESEPADFDAFWTQQKTILRTIGLDPQLTFLRTLPRGSKLYLLQLNNVNTRKTYGYLAVPASAGTHPAVIVLPPFGDLPFDPSDFVANNFAENCNAITLQLTVHNTPPNVLDSMAYRPDNLLQADGYYNRLMIMGCLQAVNYLAQLPNFNGSLGITGNSQGAGLAISVGGLDSRVSAVMAANPASSEQQAVRFYRASGFPRYVKQASDLGLDSNIVRQTAKYHDVMYFAKRYKNPLLVLNGYKDDVTPAATVFAAFNQHRGVGVLLHERETGHDYPTEFWFGRYSFFKQYLTGFENPFDFTKTFDIDAGADRLNVQKDTVILRGSTALSGVVNTAVPVRWEKIEGNGTVTFSSPTSRQTSAKFSTTGTYVLRFSAEDDYKINEPLEPKYYSFCDYITVEIKSTATIDVPNITANNFKISPNPTANTCQITWQATENYRAVRLYDALGKRLLTQSISPNDQQTTLNLSALPNGIYVAEMENMDGRKIGLKVVKSL
jgi:cephalosporin-C deacetylase